MEFASANHDTQDGEDGMKECITKRVKGKGELLISSFSETSKLQNSVKESLDNVVTSYKNMVEGETLEYENQGNQQDFDKEDA